jgi:hypothetical protein
MSNPVVSNNKRSFNPDYTVEATDQGGGVLRQIVEVANLSSPASAANAPTFATVGTTSSEIIAANIDRKGLVLVNDSTKICYLAFGDTAVIGRGIRLNANGGSFTMQESTFTTQSVNAIATYINSNMTIQEFE